MQEFMFKMIDDETYMAVSYKGDEKKVVIPATYGGKPVTVLYDDLFKGHTEITEVVIPDGVTNIGGFVFDGCTNLKSVKLPEGLLELWQYAFTRSGIEVIEVPGTVKNILPFVFQDCKNLALAVFRKGTADIGAYAFKGCEKLRMVVVNSETQVRHNAFEGCDSFDPDLKIKLNSTCQCPQCSGNSKKIDVMSLLKKK